MKTDIEAAVRTLIDPLVAEAEVEIYDIEFATGILRVTLDRPGGIDVDAIGEMSKTISRVLDDHEDIVPGSNYMLEVTSPGVERKLRKPEHFAAMVGERARVKLRIGSGAARRIEGTIKSTTETSVDLLIGSGDGEELRTVAFTDIESARSVYDWTAALAAAKEVPADDIANDEKKASAR